MHADGIQPQQSLEIPSERKHLESLQAPLPESPVFPLPATSGSLPPVLPPPQDLDFADVEDRPLTDVVVPLAFDEAIEVDEAQLDELQRWHDRMIKNWDTPLSTFKRAAQLQRRDRVRKARAEKVDWDKTPLALEAPPPPAPPASPVRRSSPHPTGARRAAEWTPSALSPADRPAAEKSRKVGTAAPLFRLGDVAEPELHADELHEAMLAHAKAHSPSGYFSFVAAETADRFDKPLIPEDCSELMNCPLDKLNWVNNTYAWMVSNNTKAIRLNALGVDGLLRASVWGPSGEKHWRLVEASKQSFPPLLDYATALECEHLPADGRARTGRLKLADRTGERFVDMGYNYGTTCYLTAYVLLPDNKNDTIEVTNNIFFSNLCRQGTHLKDYLVSAKASQDENGVFFLLQPEQTWSKARGDILSVYHMALPPGSHIFKKSLFNSEAWNLHRLECAIVPLPHAGSGLGINYDKHHDRNPDLPSAFVGYSQVISKVMEGHRLGLRENGSEIHPATKKPYFKEEETPKFVSNDVTGDVYFECSDEEGLQGQDQVPSMTRAKSKAMNREIPWRLIPKHERTAFVEAARQEWADWLPWGTVQPATSKEKKDLVIRLVGFGK